MTDIQGAVESARDSHWDAQHQRLLHKNVILVEGPDDRLVLELLLQQRRPTWSARVGVVALGGRTAVLRALEDRALPGGRSLSGMVVGLVDRDLWDESEVREAVAERGETLYVTRGWCLENDRLSESVLRATLSGAFVQQLLADLEAARESWVRAGAWWRTFQRRREALFSDVADWSEYGAPPSSLDLSEPETLEPQLRSKIGQDVLALWPRELARETREAMDRFLVAPVEDQWARHVHGKAAFRRLLLQRLRRSDAPEEPRVGWRRTLARQLLSRPPFDALLGVVL